MGYCNCLMIYLISLECNQQYPPQPISEEMCCLSQTIDPFVLQIDLLFFVCTLETLEFHWNPTEQNRCLVQIRESGNRFLTPSANIFTVSLHSNRFNVGLHRVLSNANLVQNPKNDHCTEKYCQKRLLKKL